MFSERLSAPLVLLAAGTRAVAQGDFSQRHPVRSHDELGILTESFNTMTTQLDEARAACCATSEQLEAAKAYLESILAKLSAGVLSFDSERRLRSANPSAREILGVDLEPLIGRAAWTTGVARDARLAEISAQVRARGHRRGRRRDLGEAARARRPAGKVLLLRGSTLQPAVGSGFVVVFDDITRLLQAQRYAAWGEVARRLAHEIKNPLTPIQLSAERLDAPPGRQARQPRRRDAERAPRRLSSSRSRSSRAWWTPSASTRARRRSSLAAARSERVGARGARAVRGARPARSPWSWTRLCRRSEGDPARLRQVIHNLLQNAEQAVAERSRPRITVRTQRGRATSRGSPCMDNGPGFPPEMLARAFEPYVTTKAKGTGLGLAIVKKIVEEHNGSIEIRNLRRRGAEVAILLPRCAERWRSRSAVGQRKVRMKP